MKNSNLKTLLAKTKTLHNAEFMPLNDKLALAIKGGKIPPLSVNFGCTSNTGCGVKE